ncbi:uncharacterized protein LOC144129770 [Amblyomma americanum]
MHAVFKGGAEDGARNTPSPNEDPTAQEAEDSLTASLTSLGSLKEKATMKSPRRCLQLLDTIRGHLQDTEPDEEVITWLEPLLEKTAERLNIASAHLPQSSVQANKKLTHSDGLYRRNANVQQSALKDGSEYVPTVRVLGIQTDVVPPEPLPVTRFALWGMLSSALRCADR